MKKLMCLSIAFVCVLILLGHHYLYINSSSTIPERIGNEVVDKMGKHYKLSGYGWVGQNFRSRVKFSVRSEESFNPKKHIQIFVGSFESLIKDLNKSSCLIKENGELFTYLNTGYTIFWPDPNSLSDIHSKAMLASTWDDEIILIYFLEGGVKVTKYIPYDVFVKLVEEKRFDEILHYGE